MKRHRNKTIKKSKVYSGYALFDDSVKAKDKYRVTSPPNKSSIFKTREKAKEYIKVNKIKDVRIYKY